MGCSKLGLLGINRDRQRRLGVMLKSSLTMYLYKGCLQLP